MSEWFVDKLGPQPQTPVPQSGSLSRANNADSLTPSQGARPAAAPAPQPAQAKAAPAPAPKPAPPPEPEPKKKKGWF